MKVLCTAQIGLATALGQTMRIVAVAKALKQRGHQVKFLAGGKVTGVLKDHQLDVIELDMSSFPQFEPDIKNFFELDDRHRESFMNMMKEISELTMAAEKKIVQAEKPDVMVCGNLTGPVVAKSYNIPCAMVFLQPHGQKTLDLFANRLSQQESTRNQISQVMEGVNLFLSEGMPELSGDVRDDKWLTQFQNKLHYTGPLLAPAPDELPDQAALKLRHAGTEDLPLVYLTIGGGTPLIGEDFLRLALETFRQLPEVKAVISTGLAVDPGRLAGYNPPEQVIIQGFVPGTELIKASDVTVFHGGSSTLMACIACGRPAVVVPSMAEQEDNGAVLAQHQAGIVLDKQSLTPHRLAEALGEILHHQDYRANAEKLKALGEKYGGPTAAAGLIEELAAKGGPA